MDHDTQLLWPQLLCCSGHIRHDSNYSTLWANAPYSTFSEGWKVTNLPGTECPVSQAGKLMLYFLVDIDIFPRHYLHCSEIDACGTNVDLGPLQTSEAENWLSVNHVLIFASEQLYSFMTDVDHFCVTLKYEQEMGWEWNKKHTLIKTFSLTPPRRGSE